MIRKTKAPARPGNRARRRRRTAGMPQAGGTEPTDRIRPTVGAQSFLSGFSITDSIIMGGPGSP